jgi:predicted nucleic acid-binding protein
VSEYVFDASVVVKWFRSVGERHVDEARELRDRFEHGELVVIVPPLLYLELLNVAGRRWKWEAEALAIYADILEGVPFVTRTAPLDGVARWTARGLTAYDASYVALAEAEGIDLVTDDAQIPMLAPDFARPLAA